MLNASTVEAALHLTHTIKQHLDRQLEEQQLGITPMHVRMMMIIYKHSPCTAQDIVGRVKRDKAQITRLIKGLINQGLVEQKPNPKDKRSQLLELTDEGKVTQKALLKFAAETQAVISQGIDAAALENFVKVAQKMTSNLSSGSSDIEP